MTTTHLDFWNYPDWQGGGNLRDSGSVPFWMFAPIEQTAAPAIDHFVSRPGYRNVVRGHQVALDGTRFGNCPICGALGSKVNEGEYQPIYGWDVRRDRYGHAWSTQVGGHFPDLRYDEIDPKAWKRRLDREF